MKINISAIIFIQIFLVNILFSQKIIDDIYVQNGYSSENIVLYDNETFIYERGVENKSKITLGRYIKNNELYILTPIKMTDSNLIINHKSIDNNLDNPIKTIFIFNDGDTAEFEVKYTSIQNAKKWANLTMKTDSLEQINSVKITKWKENDFVSSEYRVSNDTIAVCLLSIEKLINKRIVYHIEPNFSKLEIRINAPSKLAYFINMYQCSYSEMLDYEFELKGKKFITQNRE